MKRLLHLLLFLALVPSLLALLPRLRAERPGPVALVLDAEAVRAQAKAQGQSLLQALAQYRAQGVNGVAFPERLVKDWIAEGALLYRQGRELREEGLPARRDWYYLKGEAWLLDLLQRAYHLPTERLGEWLGFPVDVQAFPAFYAFSEIQKAKEAAFTWWSGPSTTPCAAWSPGFPWCPRRRTRGLPGPGGLGLPPPAGGGPGPGPGPRGSLRGPPSPAFWPTGKGAC